ncbi:TetR family transcriptional regulator [Cohnella sp. CIP 111063]|uniref:TetR/AcrR family transcriptional regulator n=1 Tax=unclassified Cohnella TaxID=2636738 RepID=UPI000B8C4011|nr:MULTISPECIES: TetR/AcrR family transcriptional regulator [unclassified Cohnella]OXS61812.1 TetR family transcriptional regulator [Cohnella sp. CIP 111063]PRX74254.1 TetR family transcriptional regulator [Cohnella sp. SGD-V74]
MRNRIREAAVQEIRQRGLKFSVRELASRLGISTKTLYQHYASKELLIADLVELSIAGMRDHEAEVMKDAGTPLLRKLYETLIIVPRSFAFSDTRLLNELKNAYPAQWRVIDEYMNEGWDNIRQLIRQGIEEGALRPFDVDLFINAYVGAIYRLMDREAADAGQGDRSLGETLASTVELLLYGIANDREEKLR